MFLFFHGDAYLKNQKQYEYGKIIKKTKKYSYSYGLKIKHGNYSLLTITESYQKGKIKNQSLFDFNQAIVSQKLYFLKNNDTIKSLTIDSKKQKLLLKNSKGNFLYSKNELKFIAVIEGKNDFFYYLSGGEDCVSGCPEYFAFYDKTGHLLWENYLRKEGNYSKTLHQYEIEKSIYKKDAVKLIRVTPYEKAAQTINSSLIKFSRK